jgi:hypothetical protein
MTAPDPIERWKASRSTVEVDSVFADRIMEQIRQLEPSEAGPEKRWAWPLAPSYTAAAVVLFAVGWSVVRVGVVIGLILGFTEQGF